MNRTAWILDLREPFGAALGRELVSRGWTVIGGDPQEAEQNGAAETRASERKEAGLAEQRASDDGWETTDDAANLREEDTPASGWTHGPHIGENADIPTGTGTSGLNDFEGSVAFGPETNARPKSGEWDEEYAEEAEPLSFGADRNASDESGAFTAAGTEPNQEASDGSKVSRSDGESSSALSKGMEPLPEHGRMHILPLAGNRPEALEEAARRTSEIAERIDLLVLNAGRIETANPSTSELSDGGTSEISATNAASASASASEGLAEAQVLAGAEYPAEDTTEARQRDYETYALTPLRAVSGILPLMDGEDSLKRICFVTSREGSISMGGANVPIGRAMARTALHMQAKLLFNDLRREGYTFRMYDPGMPAEQSAHFAGSPYTGKSTGSNPPMTSMTAAIGESARFAAGFFANPHADESRLVLTGSRGEEWPF
ncbi:hypothetical protein [Saccharibacillus kuerlensis]|uniref:Uncharacterized protein n=1 Tax=Saccharibacillus kuerlensis TaxID=459527 RepID=A0ABQ2L4K9_9BACL|nr:hypothetical protein [Saccharibacillus kuerlensis]GGO02946.1 hypothetical protein GCM10010969_26740 [Saccharibacillus kuerlensis]